MISVDDAHSDQGSANLMGEGVRLPFDLPAAACKKVSVGEPAARQPGEPANYIEPGATSTMFTGSARSTAIAGTCRMRLIVSMLSRAIR
jgi:hypothetical protein